MKENNPQSTVEWLVDNNKQIQHLFICPAYTDQVLSYMHPVISLFIYSGLTGNDEAYTLVFVVSGGN